MDSNLQINRRLIFVCLAVLVAVIWLQRFNQSNYRLDREGYPVVTIAPTDIEMNEAMQEARATISDFVTALESGNPAYELFGVKTKFDDQYGSKYVWLVNVTLKDREFTGIQLSLTDSSRKFQRGDTISVPMDEISDWSYVDNGKLVGGYTMRVMRDRLPKQERDGLEEKLGFQFD